MRGRAGKLVILGAAIIAPAGPANAGAPACGIHPVREWNSAVMETTRERRDFPPFASRAMAIIHLSMHQAMEAHGEEAAWAAANWSARTLLFQGTARFDALLACQIPAPLITAEKADAMEAGRAIAQALLDDRAGDGWNQLVVYTPVNLPGRWRPTYPDFSPALSPHWGNVRPFAMTSGSQFRLPPPPALTSEQYAADVNEVAALGEFFSPTRTTEETVIAYHWSDEPGSALPPGHWNRIAAVVLEDHVVSVAEEARLFALLNIALADAAIAAWDSKYHHNGWRPYTAIVLADTDGNPATTKDESWTSLLINPAHPDYPSGHSTFSGAGEVVLSAFFGEDTPFTITSDNLMLTYGRPESTRSYTGFRHAADEAGRSRILGGIHFTYANQAGKVLGHAVGQHVVDTMLLLPPRAFEGLLLW